MENDAAGQLSGWHYGFSKKAFFLKKRYYLIFSWHVQSELVFFLDIGRTRNCAMLLLDVISRLEFWWHNMIRVFAIYFFLYAYFILTCQNKWWNNKIRLQFYSGIHFIFDITFLHLILAQIRRHDDKITSYLHSAFSSEDCKVDIWKAYEIYIPLQV